MRPDCDGLLRALLGTTEKVGCGQAQAVLRCLKETRKEGQRFSIQFSLACFLLERKRQVGVATFVTQRSPKSGLNWRAAHLVTEGVPHARHTWDLGAELSVRPGLQGMET